MKTCNRCKVTYPIENYDVKSRSPDGYNTICKTCTNTQRRERYFNKMYSDLISHSSVNEPPSGEGAPATGVNPPSLDTLSLTELKKLMSHHHIPIRQMNKPEIIAELKSQGITPNLLDEVPPITGEGNKKPKENLRNSPRRVKLTLVAERANDSLASSLTPFATGRVTSPTIFLPQDPNALLDRLDLLLASKSAGNTGVINEITAIIDELYRLKLIDINKYKLLTSL